MQWYDALVTRHCEEQSERGNPIFMLFLNCFVGYSSSRVTTIDLLRMVVRYASAKRTIGSPNYYSAFLNVPIRRKYDVCPPQNR